MRSTIYQLKVEFGDCDPANIVFYPNYYRWFDAAASNHLFTESGMTLDWMRQQYGAIGFPLMETGATYKRPAHFGDRLEIESRVVACAEKSIRMQHLVRRGEELLVDGFEVRFFCVPHPDDPKRLKAMRIPDEICEALGCSELRAP